MRSFEQYDEAHKYFTEEKQKDSNANEVQAQLMSSMAWVKTWYSES